MAAHSYSQNFSAGTLALLVHGLFFAVLFFGVNWRLKPPAPMEVEMWESLPAPLPVLAPPVLPPLTEAIAEPKPVEVKAEIALKEPKKKLPEKQTAPTVKSEAVKSKKTPQQILEQQQKEAAQRQAILKQEAHAKEVEAEQRAAKENERIQALKLKMRAADEKAAREAARIQERQAQMRAEMDEATQREVARYKDMIRAKIRRNIVMPDGVPPDAEAKFALIVLPGGTVVAPKLIKSSGNAAYDRAAERAIQTAQPLPLPQDEALARTQFRELNLSVKPQ